LEKKHLENTCAAIYKAFGMKPVTLPDTSRQFNSVRGILIAFVLPSVTETETRRNIMLVASVRKCRNTHKLCVHSVRCALQSCNSEVCRLTEAQELKPRTTTSATVGGWLPVAHCGYHRWKRRRSMN
jgi:hypothetical protein